MHDASPESVNSSHAKRLLRIRHVSLLNDFQPECVGLGNTKLHLRLWPVSVLNIARSRHVSSIGGKCLLRPQFYVASSPCAKRAPEPLTSQPSIRQPVCTVVRVCVCAWVHECVRKCVRVYASEQARMQQETRHTGLTNTLPWCLIKTSFLL